MSMESFLLSLPSELIIKIGLSLSLSDIYRICLTDTKLNDIFCNNQYFWKMKYIQDFQDTPNDIEDWKKNI